MTPNPFLTRLRGELEAASGLDMPARLAQNRLHGNAPTYLAALLDVASALIWVEAQYCPCGARAESPETHPHVLGCPVAAALERLEEL